MLTDQLVNETDQQTPHQHTPTARTTTHRTELPELDTRAIWDRHASAAAEFGSGRAVVQTSFMPDFSVVTTVISTIGALLGALGGVALTHRANIRREEAQFNRQRNDQRTQERRQAHADLLGTATQLKAEIEIAGQQLWKDMDVRLATIKQHATSVGLHASRVALLSRETAGAAFALASVSGRLAAATTNHAEMRYQDEQFLGGRITRAADFTEFDECIEQFYRATAQDREE